MHADTHPTITTFIMPIQSPTVVSVPNTNKELSIYEIKERLDNVDVIRLMNAGWVIISSWIDNPTKIPSDVEVLCVYGISFRLGRNTERLIVVADISVTSPKSVIPNVDADEPGSIIKIVPSTSSEMWLMRLSSIAGFGPGSGGGPGPVAASPSVPFSIMGLDIEVSTHARQGGVPLPHDDIISITISNGGWHDDLAEDVCFCIYTFGFHRHVELETGRTPTFVKAHTSAGAVLKAYEILNALSPDFVNVHNGFGFDMKHIASHCALTDQLSHTFERRRLGNTGTAIWWRLKNGISFVDSMYDIDKYLRKDWPSISLASVASILGLPPKLDASEMMVENSELYDVTDMLVYNARDSDLHAWVVKRMRTCERYFMLAGTSRSTIWDAIAGNTGQMMFCFQESTAVSLGSSLDLSRSSNVDERDFEGGFVLDPKAGCYKGVVVIDGNSLYGSIMSKLGIFIDRCASSPTAQGLAHKLAADLGDVLTRVEIGSIIEHENLILMRSEDAYMAVEIGPPTMLSVIIDDLITNRKKAKNNGQLDRSWAYKLLLVSVYGTMGSKHGVISSKTCAEITTYAARYYLKAMIEAAKSCGYEVLYGDTDSIFVWVRGTTELSCMTAALRVKEAIHKRMNGTVFASVGADVKGNYKSIVISAKKKYEAVAWDGSLETKGLAIVKKDSLPIVKYTLTQVMSILNSDDTDANKTEDLLRLIGKIMITLQSGRMPASSQVSETKINGQPHIVYMDKNMKERKILIGVGIKASDVNRKWVASRVTSAVDSVLVPVGMNSVSELLFAYESRRMIGPRP